MHLQITEGMLLLNWYCFWTFLISLLGLYFVVAHVALYRFYLHVERYQERFPFVWKNRWEFSAKWNGTKFFHKKSGTGRACSIWQGLLFCVRAWEQATCNNKHGCRACSVGSSIYFRILLCRRRRWWLAHVFYGSNNCKEKFESLSGVLWANATLIFRRWNSKSFSSEKDHVWNLSERGGGHGCSAYWKRVW